jgi:hypothetical protein
MKAKYRKPRAYKTKYAIHGPTVKNKYFLIPAGDLGDHEPNCKPIPADLFNKHSLSL